MIEKLEVMLENLSLEELQEVIKMCEESINKIDGGDSDDR